MFAHKQVCRKSVGGKAPIKGQGAFVWGSKPCHAKQVRSSFSANSKIFQKTIRSKLKSRIFDSFNQYSVKLFNNEEHWDIILKYGNLELKAHKFMMHVHSKVISKELTNLNHTDDVLVLEMEELISEDTFEAMIRFFYGLDIHLNDRNVMDIVRLSLHFKARILNEKCAEFLSKEVFVNGCNQGMLDLALELENSDLIGLVVTRMFEPPKDFNNLPPKRFRMLICSDFLCMSESRVLELVHQYIDYHETSSEERPLTREQIDSLYACVRFPQMDGEELQTIVKPLVNKGTIPNDYLVDAFEYLADPSYFVHSKDAKYQPRYCPFEWTSHSSGVRISEDGRECTFQQTFNQSPSGSYAIMGPLREGSEVVLTSTNKLPMICMFSKKMLDEKIGDGLCADVAAAREDMKDFMEIVKSPDTEGSEHVAFRIAKDGTLVEEHGGAVLKSMVPVNKLFQQEDSEGSGEGYYVYVHFPITGHGSQDRMRIESVSMYC